jgi:DNA helicase II / ATP-dependent DNA helicase PcrA
MTRARNELQLISPLKFPLTQQAPRADGHVYGGRSRFLTEKVLKCFEPGSFSGSHLSESQLAAADPVKVDVASRLKDMW